MSSMSSYGFLVRANRRLFCFRIGLEARASVGPSARVLALSHFHPVLKDFLSSEKFLDIKGMIAKRATAVTQDYPNLRWLPIWESGFHWLSSFAYFLSWLVRVLDKTRNQSNQ